MLVNYDALSNLGECPPRVSRILARGLCEHSYFDGVSVTTVILAPGACGGGLRGALPDAISLSPVVPPVPVVSSKNADLMRRHRT